MSDTERTEPTPAERTRSILATAGSLRISTAEHRIELIGLHTVEDAGRLVLAEKPGGHLENEWSRTPHGVLAALVEFTDVAAIAVRDRVRARLTLCGHLTAAGPQHPDGALRFAAAQVMLEEAGRLTAIDPDELARAEPDPLSGYEVDLLTHLDAAHQDTITRLARLIPPRRLLGATRVRPIRLDRHGLVLRVETTRAHHDTRLPFPTPADHPGEAATHIRALLTQAAACPRRLTA